jgi:transposase-like protein
LVELLIVSSATAASENRRSVPAERRRITTMADRPRMTADQVSRLCKGLDEQVLVFRERPLAACATRRW